MRRSLRSPADRARTAGAIALVIASLAAWMCGPDPNPISPSGPNIDGVYTLHLETSCEAVPEGQRTREYIATITGSPNTATMTLSNATFMQHPTDGLQNKLSIVQHGKSLSINLQRPAPVIEQIGATSYLSFGGVGNAEVNGLLGTISGALGGPVKYGEDVQNSSRYRQCGPTSGLVTLRLIRTNGPAPPPGIVHSIVSAEINGPSTLAPGSSAQFGVVARLTDGSTREVTEGLSWHSTNTSVLNPGSTGVVSGSRSGEALLQVTVARTNVEALFVQREVIVVPEGTFRVIGRVTEDGFPTAPVVGARVEVVSAVPAVSTTTDYDGRYRLYGVRAGVEIRVSQFGFEPRVFQVATADHQTIDTTLRLTQPRPVVGGVYALTISTDCPSGSLLPELQERKYTATIDQSGSNLSVTLSGANFKANFGRLARSFSGQISGNQAIFAVSYGYYYDPSVIEQLPDSVFILSGTATTTISPNSMVGTMSGWINQYTDYPGTSLGGCFSRTHKFALTR